jgi:hypothetical protein
MQHEWGRRGTSKFVRKPEGRRPVGRPRLRWLNNFKMNFRESGWSGMGWIRLSRVSVRWRVLVNTIMNFRVLKILRNSLSYCTSGEFSPRA